MIPALDVWLNHFEYHGERRPKIPEDISSVLTREEHALIAGSLATFQLGEESRGTELLTAAFRFSRENDIPQLVRITELFVREEQHHAALLGQFMDRHAIPRKKRDWMDGVFRQLRRLGDYEHYLTMLVTAELIGNVYYRALEAATQCQHLRALCRLIVSDELAHIAFESDLLIAIRARRTPTARATIELAHRAFFMGAATTVWHSHRGVLRKAGYTLPVFLRACEAQFSFYLRTAPETIVPGSTPL